MFNIWVFTVLDYRIEKIENGWDIKYVQTGSVAKNLAILQNQ